MRRAWIVPDQEQLLRRTVWIEIDQDHSGPAFSPRKGTIVRVFEKPLEKEAIAVELFPRAVLYFPYPHRVTHIVLQYSGNQTINDTFRIGVSYGRVLELKNKQALVSGVLTRKDVTRIGAADVFPWPKPSVDEIKKRRDATSKSVVVT